MKRHFDEELGDLKQKILRMGSMVENQFRQALNALITRNSELAIQVIKKDHEVNAMDVEVDELCLELLALHQPAARDLRFITTAMKISTELERISDLAEAICNRTIELNEEAQLKPYIDIPLMAEHASNMVSEALDSFVRGDAVLARQVLEKDDYIDQINEQIFRELLTFMIENPKTITRAIRLSFVSKAIERIADHATNVAELVVYMVEGKIIRHMSVS
ncbi:MAG: phosphate signaling complex protein PhoU [Nitrospirales bacterium]|nr:phosphate signaling complex protein PhoU [Nitrospira sp.]MDR4461062.1 phosphate signaling complex protein PhoU [Nitrospirales bacterium]